MKIGLGSHRRPCSVLGGLFSCAFVLLLGWTTTAWTQELGSSLDLPMSADCTSGCGSLIRLPVVPLQEPRLGQGSGRELQWQTQQPASAAPTASLVEPIKGNDAIIELVVGQGRLLTLKADMADERGSGVIAVGDPTVIEFEVLPNPRLIRLTARRAGVTDLSLVTPDGRAFNFEVHVLYDLALLQAQLKQVFPDSNLRLFQIREHLAVEGQARSTRQVEQILKTLEVFLTSVQVPSKAEGTESAPPGPSPSRGGSPDPIVDPMKPLVGEDAGGQPQAGGDQPSDPGVATPAPGGKPQVEGSFASGQIINLLQVPGVQQVLLQVQIAELDRTALRNVGADIELGFGAGNILETLLGGTTTMTGLFPTANLDVMLRILRTNALLSVLAEPNLVALSGQKASFLAGGEFPIPVPQNSGGGTTITIEYKTFGVQLEFVPYVLEDGTIRLTVNPEESAPDYTTAVEINGYVVPGINTRRASTTVEMQEGETLAIAGLLRVAIDANTKRIPGLGDLPYIGPLFSNTTHQRKEKELIVLVTPYPVNAMSPGQVPPLPGSEITDPNDLEFYLLNRISGRTDHHYLSTRGWDDPLHLVHLLKLERSNVCGPCGFSTSD